MTAQSKNIVKEPSVTSEAKSMDDPELTQRKQQSDVSSPDTEQGMSIPEPSDLDDQPVIKERKLVKFMSDPDIKQHGYESNVFGKIPPELSYLEKRADAPKLLPQIKKSPVQGKKKKKPLTLDDMPDLPSRAVKEISAVNKNTILNFNYHEVVLPIGPDRILVDVKYSSLFSLDMAKIRKYAYNISNERIGIAYDFVGEIVELGKNFVRNEKFRKGAKVFGVTNPLEKKGALQTCVIVNPSDVIFEISDQEVEDLGKIDINLPTASSSDFQIEESTNEESDMRTETVNPSLDIPPLARFCTFGSQYCRAKQALSYMDKVFKKQASANILINGADTLLGRNIVQIITSSVYQDILQSYNITLVVQEKNLEQTRSFVSQYNCGGLRNINIIAFDMRNEDLVLPGEAIPVNFKKVPFFATEVIDSILKIIPTSEKISKTNIHKLKLDLFVDIVGSKTMFQKSVDMLKIDQVNFPFKARLEETLKPSTVFGKAKGALFLKLMKPKSSGSSFVSCCDFELSDPSYLVDKMIVYKSPALDPWASSWTRGAANLLISAYNYFEILEPQIKREWVEEAYKLIKSGEFRVQISEIVEWRDNFRKHIDRLKKTDGLILFEVESF
ncbi:hypothetical protein METBIDRAFT_76052 [Metschnikowia bicuspidata var. bicuspidata NRRL YB-4993]|uniref:Uncharacterized protein n=1 Tax=Metschnikowia bicuspidata var. bicuspidata NRRL YB-4993 TaxID=869754 RepID=A0A1A0HG96_9ASCO|nr:hypothetical protein METBIDRAFT_76052 [Metschnikowia bicuspidata var. bicuspidata NRRL YB-4993]OBA22902.1 hypothetical protein METBIDRAFT_76052 [Metschnikowia bicuspidata var. bicuspidata NRRL YB-4993]